MDDRLCSHAILINLLIVILIVILNLILSLILVIPYSAAQQRRSDYIDRYAFQNTTKQNKPNKGLLKTLLPRLPLSGKR